MEIVRNDIKEKYFSDLPDGAVFEYEDTVFIKIIKHNNSVNALEIETGRLVWFYFDYKVIPLNAKLVIE